MPAKTWAKDQPKDGDIVLHCGHAFGSVATHHWWEYPDGLPFTRPNQTTGNARWRIACNACFLRGDGDPDRIPVRGDATWCGDAPVLPERMPS